MCLTEEGLSPKRFMGTVPHKHLGMDNTVLQMPGDSACQRRAARFETDLLDQ